MKTKIRRFLIFSFLLFATQTVVFAQRTQPKRIKILILGTFHFGETNDANKTDFPDLLTQKRQKGIAEVVASMAKFKPDKSLSKTNLRDRIIGIKF